MTTQHDPGHAFQRGCGLYALGILFLFTLALIFAKIQADHFWDGGVHVEGVVISVDNETIHQGKYGNKAKNSSERVQFEYLVNGQPFRHRQLFSYNTSFYVGQTVPVVYLPNAPWTAETLVDKSIDPFMVFVTGLSVLVLAGLSIDVYRGSLHNKQKRKEKTVT
jgi:hypothetical protein